jgi:hypothetical protein
MRFEDAKVQVEALVAEWVVAQETASRAGKSAAALSQIITGYVDMYPKLRETAEVLYFDSDGGQHEAIRSPDAPRGAEAVRVVLQETPNSWWYITELVTRLRSRGWLPESDNPANAVRTACERLLATEGSDVHKGRGMSTGRVIYSYRPDDEPWDGEVRQTYEASAEEPF